MIKTKYLIALFCALFIVAIVVQPRPVEALDFNAEYTNQAIPAGQWFKIWDTFSTGDTISGYFETHASSQGLDFFICDQANLDLWEGGYTATVYHLEEDMHTLGYSFTVTSDDTWYCVYSNEGGSSTVTADIGWDKNDDNIPYYDPSSWDLTGYGEVLEPDDYYHISDTYYAGTKIDGWYETFFPTDGVDFFICDATNYNLWYTGYSATVYSHSVDMHIENIDEFTIPTTGIWHIVFVAADEADTVTLSFGLTVDTSGATTPTTTETTTTTTSTTPSTSTSTDSGSELSTQVLLGIGISLFLGILLIACIFSRRKGGAAAPSGGVPPSSPSGPVRHEAVKEREVTTRVLVVCPFCGAKNEQGVLKCQNCGAEI